MSVQTVAAEERVPPPPVQVHPRPPQSQRFGSRLISGQSGLGKRRPASSSLDGMCSWDTRGSTSWTRRRSPRCKRKNPICRYYIGRLPEVRITLCIMKSTYLDGISECAVSLSFLFTLTIECTACSHSPLFPCHCCCCRADYLMLRHAYHTTERGNAEQVAQARADAAAADARRASIEDKAITEKRILQVRSVVAARTSVNNHTLKSVF